MDTVSEIKGDGVVQGLAYEYKGEKNELMIRGVFVEIGSVPGVAIVKKLGVETDDKDCIVAKDNFLRGKNK